MSHDIQLFDERQLVGFRARELAPARLYEQLPANDEALLLALPPGIGKSRAAQGLVGHALEHDHDLVIYVAPTRGIIDEIDVVRRFPAESVVTLNPRPWRLCGIADAAWKDLERSGCAALAKATLCTGCVERDISGGDCSWPDQLDKIGTGTNLVVLTEQYLLLNPLLLRDIRARAGSRRSLASLTRRCSRRQRSCAASREMISKASAAPWPKHDKRVLLTPESRHGWKGSTSCSTARSSWRRCAASGRTASIGAFLRRNWPGIRRLAALSDIWRPSLS
jgi:hypothetical protein